MRIKMMIMCLGFFFNAANSIAQKSKEFVLSGQFKGLHNGTKVYLRTQERDTVASAISKGDQFVFKGKLPLDGRFHFIVFDTFVSKIGTGSFFLENKSISVIGELGKKEVMVIGSSAFDDEKEVKALMSPIRAKGQNISHQLMQLKGSANSQLDSTKKAELKKRWDDISEQQKLVSNEFKKTALNWIMTHNNSLYAPYLVSVYKNVFSTREMQSAYENLTSMVKSGYYARVLKVDIEAKQVSEKIAEGHVIPDFILTTPDGKKVSILEIAAENKYTLIDFWASWCKPCRSEIPTLKEVYAVNRDKGFGILGISSDKDVKKWKMAILEDSTSWFHCIESEEKEVSKTYDLEGIPAYILIDQKGKLIVLDCPMSRIKSFGGSLRGDALRKKLDELLTDNNK